MRVHEGALNGAIKYAQKGCAMQLRGITLTDFQDFPGLVTFFQDFPVLENAIIKFQDFPGFPGPVQTLCKCNISINTDSHIHIGTWSWTWTSLQQWLMWGNIIKKDCHLHLKGLTTSGSVASYNGRQKCRDTWQKNSILSVFDTFSPCPLNNVDFSISSTVRPKCLHEIEWGPGVSEN